MRETRPSARTNSSPRSRTSCAIRSRRSARPRSSRRVLRATEEQKRWSHDVISRQVHHMALLLDDLLDISRITRGTLDLRTGDDGARRRSIDAAVETARPTIDAKRHSFHRRDAAEPRAVRRGSAASGAGAVEPSHECRQVHRSGRAHQSRRCPRTRAASRSASATTASASRRRRWANALRDVLPGEVEHRTARRAASASGSRWPRDSSSCMAARSKPIAPVRSAAANSSCACPCRTQHVRAPATRMRRWTAAKP